MKKKLIALVRHLNRCFFICIYVWIAKTYAEELPQENQEPTTEVAWTRTTRRTSKSVVVIYSLKKRNQRLIN